MIEWYFEPGGQRHNCSDPDHSKRPATVEMQAVDWLTHACGLSRRRWAWQLLLAVDQNLASICAL